MTEDDHTADLRARLHSETAGLEPDIATIVREGTARGRSRRRRGLVGTTAATVVAVGAVAAAATFLGPGVSLHTSGDTGAADGAGVSSPAGTHGTAHRTLQDTSTISQHLVDLLPGDSDGTLANSAGSLGAASVTSVGGAGQPATTVTTFTSWHDGLVSLELADATVNQATAVEVSPDPASGPPEEVTPVPATPSEVPDQASSYPGPEQACKADSSTVGVLTQPCHEVANGDWAYASTGMGTWFATTGPADIPPGVDVQAPSGTLSGADRGGDATGSAGSAGSAGSPGSAAYSSHLGVTVGTAVPTVAPTASVSGRRPVCAVGASCPAPAPDDAASTPVEDVILFTTDGWRVAAQASAPDGSQDPVLGADGLQSITQDGGWFLAPGETPSPSATDAPSGIATPAPGSCDPCEAPAPPPAPGTGVPVETSPRPAADLPAAFSKLIPGTIADVVVTDGSPDHPAVRFTWNGYPVKVAIQPSTGTGGGSGGTAGGPGAADPVVTAASAEADHGQWDVTIDVTGLDAQAGLTDDQVDQAARSDAWFTSDATTSSTPATATAAPTGPRTPVSAADFASVFAVLIPGDVSHVKVVSDEPRAEVSTFTWNGHDVKVSIEPAAAAGGVVPDSGSGSSGSASSSPGHTLGASSTTVDGWVVSVTIFDLPADTTLSDTRLDHAVSSDAWFQ